MESGGDQEVGVPGSRGLVDDDHRLIFASGRPVAFQQARGAGVEWSEKTTLQRYRHALRSSMPAVPGTGARTGIWSDRWRISRYVAIRQAGSSGR